MNEIKKEIKEIKLDLLIDFYKREGRLPKGNEFIEIETYKFKIGIYLRNLKQGNLKLSENQREKLDQEIPHWDVVNKHYDKDEKINMLITFYKRKERLPKQDEFVGNEQYKFDGGIFINNLKRGCVTLSNEQRKKLDQEIPHWDVVNKHYDKDEKINMLIAFYKLEGRLPKNDEVIGNDEYEFDGGAFVQNLKQKRITLSDQQREKLDQEIPDWDVIKHKSKRIHV